MLKQCNGRKSPNNVRQSNPISHSIANCCFLLQVRWESEGKKEAKPVVQTLGLLLNFGTHPLSWFTAYEYFHSRHFRFRTSHSLSSFFATNPRYIKNCARSLSPFQNPKWIAPFGNGSFPPVAAQSWPKMLSEWPGHMCIDGHQDGKRIELGVLFLFNGAVGNGRYLFFVPLSAFINSKRGKKASFE